jgi:hypothetical protein
MILMTFSGFFWGAAAVGSALAVVMALQAMSSMIIIRFIWRCILILLILNS